MKLLPTRATSIATILVSLGCWGCGGGVANSAAQPLGEPDTWRTFPTPSNEERAPHFVRGGRPFCFVGSNNYYLMYKSDQEVRALLDAAVLGNFRVLRTWAFLDRGSLDGSVRDIHGSGHKEGIYFQYWDPTTSAPAYNDGETGLERLDFVLHEARSRGLSLILVLTNNWRDFGGMDQYLVWYGMRQHHRFYTDARVKRAYANWMEHLVSRVNTVDGVPYREDPAIFAWELANEPRTVNFQGFDARSGWDSTTIVNWADEMSGHLKSLDSNHLVSVGDEGFFATSEKKYGYDAPFGVDTEKLTALPHVDFGTFHLYPDHWHVDEEWSRDFILDHVALGRRLNKPILMEEYGLEAHRKGRTGPVTRGGRRRYRAYQNWTEMFHNAGGAGSLFWMLAGEQTDGSVYPDYDGYTIYRGDPTFDLLKSAARQANSMSVACRSEVEDAPPQSERGAFIRVSGD